MTGEIPEAQSKEDKPWDDSMKRLARSNPEAFVNLVLGADAHFIRELPELDLMTIGINLASLIFGKKDRADQDWLLRRFNEMSDLLRETPIYQRILQEGLEEGREQGLEKGRLEALRETIEDIVLDRFPKLRRLARKQVAFVDDSSLLRHLTVKISAAKDAKEVKQLLLSVDEDEDEEE